VTFYLLRDWDILMDRIRELLPRRAEPVVVELAKECDSTLGAFLRGQMTVMFALGVIYSLGLMLVGLDLALLLGMLAGLASVVPYMGFIVGIVAASIAAFFQFDGWFHLVAVWIVFGVGQMLEGMILTPLLVGDRIGLHPVAVIFAILAGGQLAGFVGILIALPVAAVGAVLLRHAHASYKVSALYEKPQASEQQQS
jgi:predicted PurR-regulated permease PerM